MKLQVIGKRSIIFCGRFANYICASYGSHALKYDYDIIMVAIPVDELLLKPKVL